MIANPIIPITLMGVICLILLLLKRKGIFSFIRQIIIVVLLFAINLRIMVPNDDVPTIKRDVDVLFVVDNTISIVAEDYGPEKGRRIDAVRNDCNYIMEQLPGASFSVVSFGNEVKSLLPYTIDTINIKQALQTLNGQPSLYATGTAFDRVLTYLGEFLDRDNDHYQIVFFFSDGEITKDEKLQSYPELAEYIDTGAVLGYGTEEGGPMRAIAFTGDNEPEYLEYYDDNFNFQRAISVIDENTLRSIASDMGVSYVHMTEQNSIDETLAEIKKQIEEEANEDREDSLNAYSDTFFYLLIPLIFLLAVDFIYYKRKVNI